MRAYVLTQRRVEADTHEVEPVRVDIVCAAEGVAASVKGFVGRFLHQPVVWFSVDGVYNGGVALQVTKQLWATAIKMTILQCDKLVFKKKKAFLFRK